MAQTLYMVLVDTTEATPKEVGDKLAKYLEDDFSGFALWAVSDPLSVEDTEGFLDLTELQFDIEQKRG